MNTATKLLTVLDSNSGAQSYASKASGYGDLLFHWALDEASGTTATNQGSVASANGTANASDILGAATGPDGGNAPLFVPGDGDEINIQTTALASNWPTDGELTVCMFAQVSAAGVWTDGVADTLLRVFLSSNQVYMWGVTNSRIRSRYQAGGTNKDADVTGLSTTAWFHISMTVSASNDRLRTYFDGSQVGADVTGLGTWAGSPIVSAIGSATGGATPWNGSIREVLVYGAERSAAEIAELATI